MIARGSFVGIVFQDNNVKRLNQTHHIAAQNQGEGLVIHGDGVVGPSRVWPALRITTVPASTSLPFMGEAPIWTETMSCSDT